MTTAAIKLASKSLTSSALEMCTHATAKRCRRATKTGHSHEASRVIQLFAFAALSAGCVGASAQVTRGFIGPHEYGLPDPNGMKPWNVFVEYATLQHTNDTWSARGDRESTSNARTIVALSKYVHFWTPSSLPNLGLGWEVIVPKVGIRNRANGDSAGGIADPITGPAFWIKASPEWTVGGDFFVQVPLGNSEVGGGTRWNIIGSVFADAQYGKFNYTGDLGYNIPGKSSDGAKPGFTWYTNHRFGYRATDLIEPFVGLDYERQSRKEGVNLANHELAAAVGLVLHTYPHSNITLHYSRGISGENRAVSNNANIRFVYAF